MWSAESNATDAFTPLVLASACAPQLRRAPAIVPVHTRGQVTLAMSAATLAAIPDSVLDDLVVHGPAEYCRERAAGEARSRPGKRAAGGARSRGSAQPGERAAGGTREQC